MLFSLWSRDSTQRGICMVACVCFFEKHTVLSPLQLIYRMLEIPPSSSLGDGVRHRTWILTLSFLLSSSLKLGESRKRWGVWGGLRKPHCCLPLFLELNQVLAPLIEGTQPHRASSPRTHLGH